MYDIYFENKGKCPACGRFLIMHLGCYRKWPARHSYSRVYSDPRACPIAGLSRKKMKERFGKRPLKTVFGELNRLFTKHYARRNLDIQYEKTYRKADDTGVSQSFYQVPSAGGKWDGDRGFES